MDDIDPNNPNLDGDFKEVFRVREKLRATRTTPSSVHVETAPEEPEPETGQEASDPDAIVQCVAKSIHEAARAGKLEAVQQHHASLGQYGVDMCHSSLRDPSNNATVLHSALHTNSTPVARFLIKTAKDDDYLIAEFDITVRNTASKKTSLHYLAEYGDRDTMDLLLSSIASESKKKSLLYAETLMEAEGQRPRNFSAIHIAALKGHTDIIDLLCGMGVDVNLTNNKHDTPALWAARGNHIDTMRRLIQLKANLNHQNDKGSSPLYWAVRYGFRDMTRLLVEEGHADVHQQRKLGLVSPVVLAAALGYSDILKLLLHSGADVNTRITDNQTAIHFAAANGMDDIVELLLNNNAHCDSADDMGNTPLHLATKNGHHSTMALLCSHGANIDARNMFGKTVWNMAMECPVPGLLHTVVRLYRKKKRLKGRKLIFPVGRTPLHEAAMLGDVDKIQLLIQEGADPHALDQHNNTFFHLAARENKVAILNEFLGDGDVNVKNKDGDTAMHLAADKGHLEAVQALIKHSKLDIINNNRYTPLHKATWTYTSSVPVVRILMETIIKNSNWSLVDAKDNHGNTALHLAASRNHDSLIEELGSLNPSCLNDMGDNPLHTAAKKGHAAVIEAMLLVFNKPGKGLDINQENGEGETLLHICAKACSQQLVQELIEVGADLSKKNKQGNTVLHELAEETVLSPSNVQRLLTVFHEVVESAAVWWCIKHDLPRPDESSDMYMTHQRTALIYLISEVHNFEGFNVLAYCAKLGSLSLFQEILNTENVCRLSSGKTAVFDITNMTPDTVTEKARKKKSSVFSRTSSVGVGSEPRGLDDVKPSSLSYIDIITAMSDEVLATQFLDVTPVRQISENLFNAYQWIYIILLVVQIVYMSCLTVYGIPCIAVVFNTTSSAVKYTNPPTIFPFILFLIWPFLIVVFGLFILGSKIKAERRNSGNKSRGCSPSCRITNLASLLIDWIFNNLAEFTAWVFSILVVVWYALYLLDNKNQAYILAVVMLIGWMFTIVFTKGFKTVHAFSTMLSYIIIRDVTRFLVIYMFVLVGFALALHSLFQIPVSVAAEYASPWHTLFLTFNLMLGTGELFSDDFDQSYKDAGSDATYVKIFYLFYIILATIILLNLLIAMLSDTYNEIKSKEGTTWRVRSVQMAIRIERWMPFFKKLAIRSGVVDFQTRFDDENQRWLLNLPGDTVVSEKEGRVNEISRGLQRMEERMGVMESTYGDMSDKLDQIIAQMLTVQGGSAQPTLKPKTGTLRKRRTTRQSLLK